MAVNKSNTHKRTIEISDDVPQALEDQLVRQLERGAGSNFVVGNFADVQRAGAEAVAAGDGEPGKGSGFSAGVQTHPDVDADDAKAGAERTLAEEEAAKNPPPAPEPADSTEPITPKDPTSQSPQPVSSAKKSAK